jgi:hypothetical protein
MQRKIFWLVESGFCVKIYYGKLNQIIYTLSVCSHHVKNQQRCTVRGIHRNIKLNVVLIGLIHKLMMLKRALVTTKAVYL